MSFIYIVPESHAVIVERFGKFSRVQKSGLRIKIPFIEQVKKPSSWNKIALKEGYFIELAEQQSDTAPRQCQTKDNVTIEADAVIYWRIIDPHKALYAIDILPKSINDSALNALRSCIGELSLDQLLSGREQLNERVSEQMASVTLPWGVITKRVEVQEIKYSEEIADAMRQEMSAERKKRALLLESEGEAQALLNKARSKAEALVMSAQAEAEALKLKGTAELEYLILLAKSGDKNIGSQVLMAQKYTQALESISQNSAHKIFLPNNFTGMARLLMSEEV